MKNYLNLFFIKIIKNYYLKKIKYCKNNKNNYYIFFIKNFLYFNKILIKK